MPDLRTDRLTARTVLVAENRAFRPNEFNTHSEFHPPPAGEAASAAGQTRAAASCPFCPGNESQTPPPEYEQLDDSGHWQVRVISNKYPAVTLGAMATDGSPLTSCIPAVGAHEVIVESARHIDRTSALSELELRHVLEAYAERLRHWRNDHRLAYGLVFKNQGPRAGASIAHLHSQLLTLPATPPKVEAELSRAREAFERNGSCPYCRLLEQERAQGDRLVFDRDGFVVFCPFASLQPHEVWLLPTSHEPSFERAASADALSRLAAVLHPLVARLESIVPAASYNLLLRTAPWKIDCDNWFHWRIELLPRVNAIAGLEVATGMYINPIPPERAARNLRQASS
jgi:UDPglucose--hexose-1-phosphate uridylyltransferase